MNYIEKMNQRFARIKALIEQKFGTFDEDNPEHLALYHWLWDEEVEALQQLKGH